MLTKKMGTSVAVRLDRGEEIMESLTAVVRQFKIKTAAVSGIGTTKGATVCLYDIEKQQFSNTELPQFLEITNLCGNVTQMDGVPYLHLHITLADGSGNAFGGHLKQATVGATAELFLTVLDGEIRRVHDDGTGLNVWSW